MLKDIARAQELAVQVAEANLKEYVRVTYVLDDAVLKELQYKVRNACFIKILNVNAIWTVWCRLTRGNCLCC